DAFLSAGEFDDVCLLCTHTSVLQAEIVKRLNAICAQVIPFLSQEVRVENACHLELRNRWVRERMGGRKDDGENCEEDSDAKREKYTDTHINAQTNTQIILG
ncbi:hypothetical protein ILYODFUR_036941, partial [Ilyodon furcidens]